MSGRKQNLSLVEPDERLALEGFEGDQDPMIYAASHAAREIFEEMQAIEAESTGLCLDEVYWDRASGELTYVPAGEVGPLRAIDHTPSLSHR